jgi:hypothetical protein
MILFGFFPFACSTYATCSDMTPLVCLPRSDADRLCHTFAVLDSFSCSMSHSMAAINDSNSSILGFGLLISVSQVLSQRGMKCIIFEDRIRRIEYEPYPQKSLCTTSRPVPWQVHVEVFSETSFRKRVNVFPLLRVQSINFL